MKILANHNEHTASTAERLESYARRIATLEAELATERARLDWLERNPSVIELRRSGYQEPSTFVAYGIEHGTLRAAIDAAMKESK